MKTVTVREFYRSPGLVDGLTEGTQLLVTANGKPKFVVSKSARPKMSRALAEKRAVGHQRDAWREKPDRSAVRQVQLQVRPEGTTNL